MLNNKDKLSYIIQIASGFIPLVAISLLSRGNGLEFMGQYFLALSIIGTTQAVVDYGFNLSAVRSFSKLLEDRGSAGEIWSLLFSIMSAKLIISIILIALFLTYSSITTHENIHVTLIYVVMGIFLSITNASALVFALKQSVYLSIATFTARIIFLVPLLITKPSLWLALALAFAPIILSNIYSFRISSQYIDQNFHRVKIRLDIAGQFIAGRSIFLNSILASLVSSAWPILLVRSLSHTELGAYGIADKILKGLMAFVTPLAPFILATNRASGFISSVRYVLSHRLYCILVLAAPLFPLILMLLPDTFFSIMFGSSVIDYRTVLNLYGFAFILCFVNMISYTYMIILKREVMYAPIVVTSFCISLLVTSNFGFYIYTPIIYEICVTSMLILLMMAESAIKLTYAKK